MCSASSVSLGPYRSGLSLGKLKDKAVDIQGEK